MTGMPTSDVYSTCQKMHSFSIPLWFHSISKQRCQEMEMAWSGMEFHALLAHAVLHTCPDFCHTTYPVCHTYITDISSQDYKCETSRLLLAKPWLYRIIIPMKLWAIIVLYVGDESTAIYMLFGTASRRHGGYPVKHSSTLSKLMSASERGLKMYLGNVRGLQDCCSFTWGRCGGDRCDRTKYEVCRWKEMHR